MATGLQFLRGDPMGQKETSYQRLDLPSFSGCEGALRSYLEAIASYQKNRHGDLDEQVKALVAARWRRAFETWGYRR